MTAFAKCSEGIKVGAVELKNRLVFPPMATGKTPDGKMTEELIEYYRERARYSGLGLIITEHFFISNQGKASLNQASIAEDDVIPGLHKLNEVLHAEGVKTCAQLNHAGSRAQEAVTGCEAVGPSAVPHPNQGKMQLPAPHALTVEEIKGITQDFVAAALRAKAAGYDMIEIHSAHGYLLNQFYSPLSNKREDAYTGSTIEGRTRFQVEVIQAVRAAVGPEYPIAIRLGGKDYRDGGSSVEDCAAACRIFEEAGADLIDITGGLWGFVRPDHTEPGYFKELSVAAKAVVSVPVILTGGVTAMAEAEALLEEDAADLIGVGRAVFQNAHWAE